MFPRPTVLSHGTMTYAHEFMLWIFPLGNCIFWMHISHVHGEVEVYNKMIPMAFCITSQRCKDACIYEKSRHECICTVFRQLCVFIWFQRKIDVGTHIFSNNLFVRLFCRRYWKSLDSQSIQIDILESSVLAKLGPQTILCVTFPM